MPPTAISSPIHPDTMTNGISSPRSFISCSASRALNCGIEKSERMKSGGWFNSRRYASLESTRRQFGSNPASRSISIISSASAGQSSSKRRLRLVGIAVSILVAISTKRNLVTRYGWSIERDLAMTNKKKEYPSLTKQPLETELTGFVVELGEVGVGSLRTSNQMVESTGVRHRVAECIVVEINIDVPPVAQILPDQFGFLRQLRIRIVRRKQVGLPVKPEIDEICRRFIATRIAWRVGDAERRIVLTKQ